MSHPLDRGAEADELLAGALEIPEEERGDFLAEACGDDRELLVAVKRLLRASAETGDLLETGGALKLAGLTAGAADSLTGSVINDTSDQETDALVGEMLGRYRILGSLGKGGMGAVYEAEDPELRRKVALKMLPAAFAADPNRLARFQREARSVAALNHPNIVTIHTVEKSDVLAPSPVGGADTATRTVHFLTMELVQGEPLDRLIPRKGLDLGEILGLAAQLADGLRYAHERGIIHRDLKPANVIVGTEGRLRILDFGLAKAEPAQSESSQADTLIALTADGKVLGTAPYMSPEQAAGRACDHRSDIFSLGSILYEMSTGRRPFPGESFAHVISAIQQDEPTSVAELRSDLPEGLQRIIQRCLEKEPAKRYQTAGEVRDALKELQQQTPALRKWAASPPRSPLWRPSVS